MKWIVGLDLRPSSQGAIEFARWLSNTSKDDQTFIGVHVLEEEHLRVVLRYHHLDEVVNTARESADRVLSGAQAGDLMQQAQIVQGTSAEKSLEAARVYHHADGIIIGRQAASHGRELVRLGRVARRTLRLLPAPVFVVPPDLETDSMGKGPVIALTKLSLDSIDACRFAIDLAKQLGRKALFVHVVPMPEDYGAAYLPESSLNKLRIEHMESGTKQLEQWCKDHGFSGVEMRVLQGQLTHHVQEVAEEVDATLLVVGSRKLTVFERLLLTSVGSELAAVAPCPVAVIPPADSQ